ncbi:MAG: glycosyltransferase, partial [Defluviitaleaceae bacterium]|nr:glycosyltransferase [Defluviitaleaceae bacterium]
MTASFENTKVLITSMGMDIGGAETYVLELCKELRRRGLEVFVASNGGVYETELIAHGVKHFKVPMHNKKISNLITSYNSLKRIIEDNDINLVHAHARIPAFICGLLQKRMKHKFRFVTTAHAHFSKVFAYKLLSNWGEATLAVAEDIQDNLINNFKLPKEQIRMTVNGINTEKFNGNTNFSGILKEFDLSPQSRRIVNVGRIDRDMSHAAHRLIDITPQLHQKDKNLRIIIVGHGNDFENVKSRANAVNQQLGAQIVILTGTRTDINKFLAAAHIFVGVSRSAMEAMICGIPAVLAGGQGYIGIFEPSKLASAMSTNFTARGFEAVTAENLRRDLSNLLDASPDKLRQLGDFGRETIRKHYSVKRMA